MTVGRATPRRRHFFGLLVVGVAVVGIGAACTSDGSSSPSDTVNFTGNGTAELVLAGDTFTFTVACETTDLGGRGTLLVSGTGPRSIDGGSGIGLEVRVEVASATGTIGANLGGDPPMIVDATEVGVEFDENSFRADAEFVEVETGRDLGQGTLTVDGCSPG